MSVATEADAAPDATADAVDELEGDAFELAVDVGDDVDEAVFVGVAARENVSRGDKVDAPEGGGVALPMLLLLGIAEAVDDALTIALALVVAVADVDALDAALTDCVDVDEDDAVGAANAVVDPVASALVDARRVGPALGLEPLVAVPIEVIVAVELRAAFPVARDDSDARTVATGEPEAAALKDAAPVAALDAETHAVTVPLALSAAVADADGVDERVPCAETVALTLTELDLDASIDCVSEGLAVIEREAGALTLSIELLLGRRETLGESLGLELPLAVVDTAPDAEAFDVGDDTTLVDALADAAALPECSAVSLAIFVAIGVAVGTTEKELLPLTRELTDALVERDGLPDDERDAAPELDTLRVSLAGPLADGEPDTRGVALDELDSDTDGDADEHRVAAALPTADSDCDRVSAALGDATLWLAVSDTRGLRDADGDLETRAVAESTTVDVTSRDGCDDAERLLSPVLLPALLTLGCLLCDADSVDGGDGDVASDALEKSVRLALALPTLELEKSADTVTSELGAGDTVADTVREGVEVDENDGAAEGDFAPLRVGRAAVAQDVDVGGRLAVLTLLELARALEAALGVNESDKSADALTPLEGLAEKVTCDADEDALVSADRVAAPAAREGVANEVALPQRDASGEVDA